MTRILLLIHFAFASVASWTAAMSQQADTLTVNLRQYVIPTLPLPGQPMQVSRFPFTGIPGSVRDTVLEFKHVEIGKWDGVRMYVGVTGNRIVSIGIEARSPKTVKMIRKQLVKDFGSPFSLELYKHDEVLTWIPNEKQRFHMRLVAPPDDRTCSLLITK